MATVATVALAAVPYVRDTADRHHEEAGAAEVDGEQIGIHMARRVTAAATGAAGSAPSKIETGIVPT